MEAHPVVMRPELQPRHLTERSNPQFQGSAEQQRCCSVPVALRAPAPPELQRWAFRVLDEGLNARTVVALLGESHSRRASGSSTAQRGARMGSSSPSWHQTQCAPAGKI